MKEKGHQCTPALSSTTLPQKQQREPTSEKTDPTIRKQDQDPTQPESGAQKQPADNLRFLPLIPEGTEILPLLIPLVLPRMTRPRGQNNQKEDSSAKNSRVRQN